MRTVLLAMPPGVGGAGAAATDELRRGEGARLDLPELLVMDNGIRVSTAADWTARRAEIRSLLEMDMFGRAPGRPKEMRFEIDSIDSAALGGKAIRKQVSIYLSRKRLALLLYLPAKATGPVPVFVGLDFGPNQGVSADPGIPLAGAWIQNKDTKAIELQGGRSPRGDRRLTLAARDASCARLRPGDECTTATSSPTSTGR